MIVRKFKVVYCEELGSRGFLLENAPSSYQAVWGMGMAHDVLEHARNDDGSVEAEMTALGAMMYLRGQGGYWRHENYGFQLSGAFEFLANKGLADLAACPYKHRPCEPLTDWIRNAKKLFTSQYDDGEYDEAMHHAPAWLLHGWRRTASRYAKMHPCHLVRLFHNIEQQANNMIMLLPEGATVKLSYHVKSGFADLEQVY